MAEDTLLPGADPIISPSISEQFVRSQAMGDITDLKMKMFALGAMYGEQRDRLRGIEQNVKEVARRVIEGGPLPGAMGSAPPGSGGGPPRAPSGAQPSSEGAPIQPASPYPQGTVVDDQGQPVAARPADRVGPMTYSEGRMIGSSAAGLAGLGAKYLSQRTPTFNRDDDGNLVPEQYVFDPAAGPQQAYLQRDPRTGQVIQAINAADSGAMDAVNQADQGSARMRAATGALQRLGAGEGIMGALGGGARAGAVGLAVGAAYTGIRKIGDFAANQNAAAAQYRQAYGQEAGFMGLGGRFERWATGLEGFFTGVGNDRAQAGYDQAVALGLRGDRLDQATEFDTDMYKQFGMSPEQSMQFVQMSAQNANVSLDEFRTQIEAVSAAAVEAGRSSQVAIDGLAATAQQLTAFADTGIAPQVAGRLNTQIQQNMPTNLAQPENITAAAATLNDQNILMNATMAGSANPMAALTAAQADPNLALGNIEATLQQSIEMIANSGAGMTAQQLRAEMEAMFGGKPNQDEWVQITQRWPNLNPIVMRSVFQAMGYAVPPGDEFQTFIEGLFGGFEGIQPNGDGTSAGDMIKRMLGIESGPRIMEGAYNEEDVNKALDRTGAGNTDLRAYGLNARGAADEYREYGERTGNRNTAIEDLIQHSKDLEERTGQDFDDIKYDTSQGEKSLIDIINSKDLRAELVAGSVNVKTKGGESIGISEYIGSPKDPEGNTSGVLPSGDSAMVGGVRLDLTPAAMQILRLTGPTDAQRSGVPEVGTVTPFNWRR